MQLWDSRFQVSWLGDSGPFSVRALGSDGIKLFKKNLPKSPEKAVLATLPSFWNLEELVAVPHIHYRNANYTKMKFIARFHPAKPLAGRAFFSMNI